ncbi:copper-binding protein [Actimicrobium antarcticum]|uniref:Copper-binding protein n=1 Tax=Actimicrobium antarcticum TaxID=1051899 RepID=A0ABP7SSY2_9BURK
MKSMTTLVAAVAIALSSLAVVPVAIAADTETVAPATSISTGEIRKVDKDAGKITIRHGELKNLGMPAMTMVFRASDPALLERLKTGDKVNFVADKVNGQFVAKQVEVQK